MTTKREGVNFTVALNGELNTLTAPEFKSLLEENLPETDSLCLDFAGCDFVSSSGLRVLLSTYKSLKTKKGSFKLVNIGPSFSEVLNITGLDAVFGLK
ncbi:MAG: STAS domain-containing protein [Lachnospiraceae bacterium]|nr:STAS domain-containing protein [Lachnospiraceae bacterium]